MSGPPPLPRPPVLPGALADLAPAALEPESLLEQVALGDCDLSAAVAPGVAVRAARLHGTRLAGAELEAMELTDVALDGCDPANLRAGPHGGWIRVQALGISVLDAAEDPDPG